MKLSSNLMLRTVLVFLLLGPLQFAYSQSNDSLQSKVCLGYTPERQGWGLTGSLFPSGRFLNCPSGTAVFGTKYPEGGRARAAQIFSFGNCCPLPAADVLTDRHVLTDSVCPEGMVVTGVEVSSRDCPTCAKHLRCTAVNIEKYSLSSATGGVAWGTAAVMAFPWNEQPIYRRDEIPAAIRYGVSRLGRYSWLESGCLGEPIGSLWVGKAGAFCRGMQFSVLSRRDTDSSGRTSPVTMFPDCAELKRPTEPDADCETKQGSVVAFPKANEMP